MEVIYDPKSKEQHANLLVEGHEDGEIWALATHPRSSLFATAGIDSTLRIWDGNTHRCQSVVRLKSPAKSITYSNDGTLLVLGLTDGQMTIFKDGKEFVHKKDTDATISALKFSPDGNYLAAAGGNTVEIYETKKFTPISALHSHDRWKDHKLRLV